ncbi:MAG: homoserine dehydrogenase [Cytophagales bacterium]|nr:homoserine dehydrogenase [Cytophagales bacterium]
MKKSTRIGLFGYGVVGHGIYNLLANSNSLNTEVVKICIKHREKRRDLPAYYFTTNRNELLDDESIDLIVEVIDDADAAYEIVTSALKKGKNVVTANKKMLAQHLEELVELQQKYGASLLYEGAVCGSIPVVRNLEEYYDNELLFSVGGVFNSSTNYILSKLFLKNSDYDLALKQAQDLGYVESDPTLDIEGYDALYKLIILVAHAYGVFINPSEVLHHGIQNISRYDIQYAKEKGFRIKLMSVVKKLDDENILIYVLPEFVNKNDAMYWVEYEDNAVSVEAAFSDKQFFRGKGAGGHPTGSAVLSDISANSYQYKYEYKKLQQRLKLNYTSDVTLEVYLRFFDEKKLQHFNFEKITERYTSKEFNYVVGQIKLSSLLAIQETLNTSDVLLVSTGKIIKD